VVLWTSSARQKQDQKKDGRELEGARAPLKASGFDQIELSVEKLFNGVRIR